MSGHYKTVMAVLDTAILERTLEITGSSPVMTGNRRTLHFLLDNIPICVYMVHICSGEGGGHPRNAFASSLNVEQLPSVPRALEVPW